jgi:hypothetical protein
MTQKESKCQICGRVIYFEGICYDCRQRQKWEAYQAMTDAEADEKIEAILAALALGGNFYKKDESYDFPGLLAYKNISTGRFAHEAARAGVYYPEELYRDARPTDLDTLIGLLTEPACEEANDI